MNVLQCVCYPLVAAGRRPGCRWADDPYEDETWEDETSIATSCSAFRRGNGAGYLAPGTLFRVKVKMLTAVVIDEPFAQALRRNLVQTAGDMPSGLAFPNEPGYGFLLICHDQPFIFASLALTALHVADQFDFENVAFSRDLRTADCRYLTCAACELGILGIARRSAGQGPDIRLESFVAASRVVYEKPTNPPKP